MPSRMIHYLIAEKVAEQVNWKYTHTTLVWRASDCVLESVLMP